jgi:sortase A
VAAAFDAHQRTDVTALAPSDEAMAAVAEADGPSEPAGPELTRPPVTPGRLVAMVAVWLVVTLACSVLVLYLLEPMFQQRNQTDLLRSYRTTVLHSAHEADSLAGVKLPTRPPTLGQPVAVLEIARLHLRQVVVEGVAANQTQNGPGHVPGTAGPGQSGNSAIVGRRAIYGGPFGSITDLHEGDRILVTTTQGQSVYEVKQVHTGHVAHIDALYRTTADNRLTLVTSASAAPWNRTQATVVVAAIVGRPFQPTPQNHRSPSQTGTTGQASAWWLVVLALGLFAVVAVVAVVLYRRTTVRVAYLITAPVLIVAVVLLAEASSRLLPAWS